jgi:hypothetical protein
MPRSAPTSSTPTRRLFALVAALAFLALPAPAPAQQPQGEPQATLPTEDLWIETERGARYQFTVEMATTPRQQSMGLMFREEMAADGGMLFVFPEVRPASFWMRNTLISLDMLFIDAEGTILNIHERTEPLTDTSRPSAGPVRGVLEINGGLSDVLGIEAGDRVLNPAFGTAPEEAN